MIPSLRCKGGMSMVMTRVRIEPSKTTSLRALTNPAVMHGVVQSSLSAKEIRALWRVDLLNGNRYLLMISPEEPDLERLAGQIGIPGEPSSKDYDAFLEGIAADDSYRYKITGNPTVADGKGGIIPLAKRSEGRHFARCEEDWLERKGENRGFDLRSCRITARDTIHFQKSLACRVTIHRVTYEGLLTVRDPDTFRHVLTDGIGREKAYGCGLLTVVPAR